MQIDASRRVIHDEPESELAARSLVAGLWVSHRAERIHRYFESVIVFVGFDAAEPRTKNLGPTRQRLASRMHLRGHAVEHIPLQLAEHPRRRMARGVLRLAQI